MIAMDALAVGDEVALATVPSHCRGLKVGDRGVVLVVELPFGAVSVGFGAQRRGERPLDAPRRVFMVRTKHLQRAPTAEATCAAP
ncbi:MAG TPA: hypothetical protein VII06_33320 [Chloroflexota bacterium]